MADCIVRSRIDPHVKDEAVMLFEQLGLTLSEAIRIFVYQSVAEKGIPFTIGLPNAKTKVILKKARFGKDVEVTSLEQLSQDWDKACEK